MGGYNLNPESANIEDVVNQAGTPQAPPAQPPTQQPQQAPPDQIKQGLDTAAQHYKQQVEVNTPKPASGGPIRSLLQNFFSGMGQSMMSEAGLSTPYEKQQKALSGLQGVANAQGMLDLHAAQASQYAPTPLVGLDQKPILDAQGKQVVVPAHVAAPYYAALAAAGARVTSAETSVHKPITVPGIGAFNWDDQQNKYVPVGGGQIPQHQLAPGEAEKLGFPAGTAQIPEALYNQAIGAATKPLTTVQGANDQFQFNRLTGVKTPLGVGNPRIAAVYARAVQVADPNTPGGIKYMPAGEAMRQGVQASSSSAVKVPEGVLKDFTSGTSAKTLNSFNTATDHLKILAQLGDALNNNDLQLANKLGNKFSTATGGAAPTTFTMAKQAVAGEIAKTFKGQATEGEISAINSTLDAAQSPAQLKGAISTALRLMESKRAALMEQYDRGIKGSPAFPGNGNQPASTGGFAAWKARQ